MRQMGAGESVGVTGMDDIGDVAKEVEWRGAEEGSETHDQPCSDGVDESGETEEGALSGFSHRRERMTGCSGGRRCDCRGTRTGE